MTDDDRGFAIPALLATRTRKALGRCPLCPHVIRISQRVGLVPAVGWAHVSCIVHVNSTGRTA